MTFEAKLDKGESVWCLDTMKEIKDGKKVKSVTLAPDGIPVDYPIDGNAVEITLPPFKGFALVALEFAE